MNILARLLPNTAVARPLPPRRWWSRPTEPHILFPAIAVLALTLVWGMTLNLVRIERAAAERSAVASTRELAETYEAQVVRVLGEIDHALKLVRYASASRDPQATLDDLRGESMLPPGRLFVVSITNSKGRVVASTRRSMMGTVLDPEDFAVKDPVLHVRRPRVTASGEWRLQFDRSLAGTEGTPSGIVMVTVDPSYFVSSYETSTMGEQGLVAVVGADEVLAWRSGETVSFANRADLAALAPDPAEENDVKVLTGPWDRVSRYTITRPLFEFPVTLIVGLSEDEQLASTRASMRNYLWRASAGSVLLLLFIAALGRMSRQLATSRAQALEAQVAHATRVEHLAYHDSLTGLANRSLFSNLLSQSIKLAHRHDRRLAVLFLDLDRFKQINDTLGHDTGDQLLKEVAARLKGCLRESDTIARLGGDEFVALLPELNAVDDYVAVVARKILASISQPFTLREQQFSVTASIGIAVYPDDGLDEEALKKNADLAMYRAKEEGKNNYQFYSDKLTASSLARLALESGLRRALELEQFELHYQAKRDISSGAIKGVEALLRWRHPELGLVAPMQFIPLAEETGLIVPIGKWVLKTACLQSVAWRESGLPKLSMAVNLTSRQFTDENLLPDLEQVLAQTGMDPHMLELEITEGMLMRDVPKALAILTTVKALGIRIAIDNFGVGYSSLSRLKQFPLDTIKIDRSFIREVTSIAENRGVAAAIIAMGRTLSLTVVAQGVETKEQADFLRENACDEFQGFYMDRPSSPGQIEELLRTPGYGVETILSCASTSATST